MQKIGDITNTATPDGEFTDGSVAGGVSPTLLPAEWFNTIQRELCNIVVESGGTLDPDNDTQILEAITKIAQGIIPDFTVVSSSTDTTAGRIVNVGWQGLGGATQIAMGKVSQFLANTDSTKPEYPNNGTGFQACYAPNRRGQLFLTTDNGLHVRFTLSDSAIDSTTPWVRVYTTSYKPSASDVGALPITGGTLTGLLTVNNATPYIALRATGSDTRRYVMGLNSDGSSSFYVGKANAGSESCMLWNYTPGSGVEITTDGKVNINCKGKISVFNTDGTFVPSVWTNFDTRYQAKGNYTPAGQAYTKAESDAKYQLKGSYALVGASYTKAESDARYGMMNGFRRGGQQLRNPTDAFFGNWDSPAGCVVTGITMEGRSDGRKLGVYYRQMQYLNKQTGAWVNVGD